MSWLFWIIFICFSLYIFHQWSKGRKNLPPGPISFPMLGYNLGPEPYKRMRELGEKYGPIFSYHGFANTLIIVFTSIDSIKEALIKNGDCFMRRSIDEVIAAIRDTRPDKEVGLTYSTGDAWKEQRKFALQVFRNVGIGKSSLTHQIQDECLHLRCEIDKVQNIPFNPAKVLQSAVSNVICQLAFGIRHEYADESFLSVLDRLTAFFSQNPPTTGISFQPWMLHIPPVRRKFDEARHRLNAIHQHFASIIEERKLSFNPDALPNDYIDAFLKEAHANRGNYFTDKQLIHAVTDMFVAGTESTASTLKWAILFLAGRPEFQDRLYSEIINSIGKDRMPSLEDRLQMPFLEATLLEVQRLSTAAPQFFRRCTKSCQVMGYDIPEGTYAVFALYSALMDSDLFPEPDNFDPYRFVEEKDDGSCVVKNYDTMIPFGVGKRICLGESLARMVLFITMASLFQRYKFRFPLNEFPSMERKVGMTCQPCQFRVIAEIRQ